jgi:hypothetical protein
MTAGPDERANHCAAKSSDIDQAKLQIEKREKKTTKHDSWDNQ